MAFIPDDALDKYEDLQPKSQIAYSYLCRYRNHKTGFSTRSIKDCAEKYKWSRATYFNVKKELEKGWIDETPNGIILMVGDFSPMDKKSKKLDEPTDAHDQPNPENPIETEQPNKSKILDFEAGNKSKKLDLNEEESLKNYTEKSKKLDNQSKNLDSHIRNTSITSINQQEEEKEKINQKENFSYFQDDQPYDELLLWLRERKKLNHLPESEWTTFFDELKKEEILSEFRDFYIWVENLDWVTGTVSPNLLRTQVEAFKNREEIELRNQAKQGAKNASSGNSQQNNGNARVDARSQSADRRRNAKEIYTQLQARGRESEERAKRALLGGDGGVSGEVVGVVESATT